MDGFYHGPTPALTRGFYDELRAHAAQWEDVESLVIPAVTGRALRVTAGDVLRVTCHEGPQIVDLMVFNAEDPSERLWANQTLNREGASLTVGSRLWSTLPMFRPLMTIIE